MKNNNKRRGFTLVELLVVIAILAILATVSVVGYTSFIENARKSNCLSEATQAKDVLIAATTSETDGVIEIGSVGSNTYVLTNKVPNTSGWVVATKTSGNSGETYTLASKVDSTNVDAFDKAIKILEDGALNGLKGTFNVGESGNLTYTSAEDSTIVATIDLQAGTVTVA